MPIVQTRRRFLTNAALAGAAGLGGFNTWGRALAAEPPPEITTLRFEKDPVSCIAPQVFQELLRAEGFTDIRYVDLTEAHLRRADAIKSDWLADMIAHGEVDFGRNFAPSLVLGMDAGAPMRPVKENNRVERFITVRSAYFPFYSPPAAPVTWSNSQIPLAHVLGLGPVVNYFESCT